MERGLKDVRDEAEALTTGSAIFKTSFEKDKESKETKLELSKPIETPSEKPIQIEESLEDQEEHGTSQMEESSG